MKNLFIGSMVSIALLIGSMLGLGLVVVLMYISSNNTEVGLRNQFNAQQKTNESSFDKTWKIIQQSAEVPEHERESFRKTYVEIMQATKGIAGNGQLASFFTQAQINISSDLFQKLMITIEGQRESFHRDQQKLLDIKRRHDDIRTKFPSSFFVGSRPELEVKLVTSSKTDEAFSTGKDDDIELFKDK